MIDLSVAATMPSSVASSVMATSVMASMVTTSEAEIRPVTVMPSPEAEIRPVTVIPSTEAKVDSMTVIMMMTMISVMSHWIHASISWLYTPSHNFIIKMSQELIKWKLLARYNKKNWANLISNKNNK